VRDDASFFFTGDKLESGVTTVGRTALQIELNVAAIDAIVPSSAFVHHTLL
jgi:hypothetical protein